MKFVPRTKLIIWVGLIFIPVSVLAAVIPAVTEPGIGLTVGFLAVTIVDAAASRKLLTGIRVILPAVVRLSVGRKSEMTLSIDSDAARVKQLRLGMAFLREIYSANQDIVAELPEETPHSMVAWPFKALKIRKVPFRKLLPGNNLPDGILVPVSERSGTFGNSGLSRSFSGTQKTQRSVSEQRHRYTRLASGGEGKRV